MLPRKGTLLTRGWMNLIQESHTGWKVPAGLPSRPVELPNLVITWEPLGYQVSA